MVLLTQFFNLFLKRKRERESERKVRIDLKWFWIPSPWFPFYGRPRGPLSAAGRPQSAETASARWYYSWQRAQRRRLIHCSPSCQVSRTNQRRHLPSSHWHHEAGGSTEKEQCYYWTHLFPPPSPNSHRAWSQVDLADRLWWLRKVVIDQINIM